MRSSTRRKWNHTMDAKPAPDGEYLGEWTRKTITFTHGNARVSLSTVRAILGIHVPVRFRIVDGQVDENTIAPE